MHKDTLNRVSAVNSFCKSRHCAITVNVQTFNAILLS